MSTTTSTPVDTPVGTPANAPVDTPANASTMASTLEPVHPGSIVVGVDGSPQGDLALIWAAEQAAAEHRPLTLVHAARPTQAWADSFGYGYDPTLVLEVEGAVRTILSEAAATVSATFPDVVVHTRSAAVDPRQALVELGAEAHLVVVGSRGRGTLARLVLGSVSTSVARHATCPVVVVRPHEPGATTGGILLGVGGRELNSAAIEFAYRQAAVRGLPLTVTHCCFGSFDIAASDGTIGAAHDIPHDTPGHEEGRLALDEAVGGMAERYPDVSVTLLLGLLPVDSYLVHAAGSYEMIVVGAHSGVVPLAFLAGHDTEHALVTHAPCVVAVVPEQAVR